MNKTCRFILSILSILLISQISQARINPDSGTSQNTIATSSGNIDVAMSASQCFALYGNSTMCQRLAEQEELRVGMSASDCFALYGNSKMCQRLAEQEVLRVSMTASQCFANYGNIAMCERLAQMEEGNLASNDTATTCGNDLHKWCPSADASSASEVGLCLHEHRSVLSSHCAQAAALPQEDSGNIQVSEATVIQTAGSRQNQ